VKQFSQISRCSSSDQAASMIVSVAIGAVFLPVRPPMPAPIAVPIVPI